MTNLNPEICRRIKEARRKAGLSQSKLAAEVGCKQSALSMFEQGDGTKLNDTVIGKLIDKFHIDVKAAEQPAEKTEPSIVSTVCAPRTAFCPNPACPSHVRYDVEGRVLLCPDRAKQDPAGGKFCAVCGELLERKCPNCGAAVHDGAVCTFCGEPYIAVVE